MLHLSLVRGHFFAGALRDLFGVTAKMFLYRLRVIDAVLDMR